MQTRDAIVIGAGLNGLVAAAYLARAGVSVLVLERGDRLGGVDALHEFAPGFHAPRFLLRPSALPRSIVTDLDLARYGLRQFRVDAGVSLLPDGASLAHYADRDVLARELARFSRRDADAFTRYRRDMSRAAQALEPHLTKSLPDMSAHGFKALRRNLAWAKNVSENSIVELYEMTRLWSASSDELLSDYFESAEIRAHYTAATLQAATWGPRTATSGFRLVTPYLSDLDGKQEGDPSMMGVAVGPGGVAAALASCILAHGGRIRREAEVTDVVLQSGRATGIVLADGEEISADVILSNLDAKRSFLGLFKWKELPVDFVEHVARLRMKGATAKINLALDSAPEFPDVPQACPSLRGGVRIVGSMQDMDRAYDDWRNGVMPSVPLLFVDIPTWRDASLAPPGKHVMSVQVQYVPSRLHNGDWNEADRTVLAEKVLTQLEARSPRLKARIIAQEIALASDMEAEMGLTAGDLAQGEASLDQMFFNRGSLTPVRNFYLCSASVHPGPLLPGRAGAQAAGNVLLLSRGGRA